MKEEKLQLFADEEITPRLEGESSRAFRMFIEYRNMGPSRSLRELTRKLDKSLTAFRWSRKFNWVERVKAFDDAMDRLRLKVLAKEAVREVMKWEKRRRLSLEKAWINAELLRKTAEAMLSIPVVEEVVEDGKKKLIPTCQWRVRDAAVLLRATYEIQAGCLEAVSQSPDELSQSQLRALAGIDRIDGPSDAVAVDPADAPAIQDMGETMGENEPEEGLN